MRSFRRVRLPGRQQRRLLSASSTLSVSQSPPDPREPPRKPISSLLIANRGEIALRVQRTARRLGIETTTVYTDPDAHAQHAACGSRSLALGAAAAYLDGELLVGLARRHGIQALHPGYGFLSENAAFARRCGDAGIEFVGPPPQAMADMGDKARSKEIMTAAGVPCVPGYHGPEQDEARLLQHAAAVGFPVLLKSVRGGGGKGMRIVRGPDEFAAQLRSARAEARASFGPGGEVMLVERYVQRPRHVEVQVFADKWGACVALGERDCSVQRRHQKILEESPAPGLDERLRQDLWDKARRAASAVGYAGAGTVEFILDRDTGEFFFMEMNTRLQVEHPVTEMVTGTDLVEWQLRVAAGERLPLTQDEIAARIARRGAAVEARIYAENPDRGFMPDSGTLVHLRTPATGGDVRIDAGFVEGDVVSEAYDGMIAKLIVRGPDRETAIRRLDLALRDYEVVGPSTNIEFLKRVCRTRAFVEGDVETGFVDKWRDDLFPRTEVGDEVFAQAALGVLGASGGRGAGIGFGGDRQERRVRFAVPGPEGEAGEEVTVAVSALPGNRHSVTVLRGGAAPGEPVTVATRSTVLSSVATRVATLFPGSRAESTVVQVADPHRPDEVAVTVFHGGAATRLFLPPPAWMAEVVGTREAAASVVAPMPCKVLRNEVSEGDEVEKGAPLVVIESMKMETVIRSPQKGRIKKLAHAEGDICKAGTVLVLFEENTGEGQ